ncbi:insulin-like growth factor-binding protein 1 [Syngnathus acus]|uniref:insulin-like growth factor-binding protein 1 n=1 Tax=Syngnathus acus TaxID=161584 RepID=UPI0018864D9D|nr:insulin-like growth factor-binding protein 1 [Syngnathus acus]
MCGLHAKKMLVTAVVLAAAVAAVGSSPVVGPEPIRCAPCTEEKLSECPAVPSGCGQVLREPGCGCCMACALERGNACGVHTAHCASGLRCMPRPGEARPLHALIRGQGLCTEDQAEAEEEADRSSLQDMLGLANQEAADTQESIKAKVNAIRNKLLQQGPCHIELGAALDAIASSQQNLGEKFTTFYLPNCDKHGFYKAKQCESSLAGPPARCWCVSAWNGKILLGTGDITGDSECHQEVTH